MVDVFPDPGSGQQFLNPMTIMLEFTVSTALQAVIECTFHRKAVNLFEYCLFQEWSRLHQHSFPFHKNAPKNPIPRIFESVLTWLSSQLH